MDCHQVSRVLLGCLDERGTVMGCIAGSWWVTVFTLVLMPNHQPCRLTSHSATGMVEDRITDTYLKVKLKKMQTSNYAQLSLGDLRGVSPTKTSCLLDRKFSSVYPNTKIIFTCPPLLLDCGHYELVSLSESGHRRSQP